MSTKLTALIVIAMLSICAIHGTDGNREAAADASAAAVETIYFPPPGAGLDKQSRKPPEALGVDPAVAEQVRRFIRENPYRRSARPLRWALWRNGHLLHVEGDFDRTDDVASLRKTWHAMSVGAALFQGKIPSLDQKLGVWLPELKGTHAQATWRHVITQSSGFDYPHGEYPAFPPGEMWTYSDWNPVRLSQAMARVFGKRDYHDNYAEIVQTLLFDAIGMEGWSIGFVKDGTSGLEDGVRFRLSLDHMGRLGLLALARGSWNGRQLVAREFVEQLETKQTRGMKVNYQGPNDGQIDLDPHRFQECPYGYMTWVNTDGDYFPGANPAWACGRGAGGSVVLWNHRYGVVFAGFGISAAGTSDNLPRVLERALLPIRAMSQAPLWGRFETAIGNPKVYADPYRDVSLDALFTRPDGRTVRFWGFHDGGQTWRLRFMPDQPGEWKYEANFSDGAPGARGAFLCVPSDLPGMIAPHESNPVWFGYRGGDAVLMRGLHVGDRFFARNWDDPASPADGQRRAAFLDWAQRQGCNLLSVASHYLNRNSAGRGRGWNTPKLWPLSAAEYRSMEMVLDDLASRRMLVYPFAGFFGRSSSYPDNPADQALYLRYTYARLGAYWNLMLNVAGPEPLLPNNAYLTRDQANRLGSEIQRLNVFGKPLSIHNPTGNDLFRDEPWLNYGTLQGPKTVDRAALGRILLRNHHPRKPLLAQETLWSGNINHIRSIQRDYTDDDLRKNTMVIHFSAASLVFADNDGDSSSGFSGTMDPKDCRQNRHDAVRRAWDLCAALPFAHLQPCPDAVSGSHAFCLAKPGIEYLIYLERTAPVTVTLEGGPYQATWMNARQPSWLEAGGTARTGQVLQPPSREPPSSPGPRPPSPPLDAGERAGRVGFMDAGREPQLGESPPGDDWILHLRRSAE